MNTSAVIIAIFGVAAFFIIHSDSRSVSEVEYGIKVGNESYGNGSYGGVSGNATSIQHATGNISAHVGGSASIESGPDGTTGQATGEAEGQGANASADNEVSVVINGANGGNNTNGTRY